MTMRKFLRQLRKTRKIMSWDVDLRTIEAREEGNNCDVFHPITAVCKMITGKIALSEKDAAKEIGLCHDLIQIIKKATFYYRDPGEFYTEPILRVRRDILRACGLLNLSGIKKRFREELEAEHVRLGF